MILSTLATEVAGFFIGISSIAFPLLLVILL